MPNAGQPPNMCNTDSHVHGGSRYGRHKCFLTCAFAGCGMGSGPPSRRPGEGGLAVAREGCCAGCGRGRVAEVAHGNRPQLARWRRVGLPAAAPCCGRGAACSPLRAFGPLRCRSQGCSASSPHHLQGARGRDRRRPGTGGRAGLQAAQARGRGRRGARRRRRRRQAAYRPMAAECGQST